MVKVIATSIFYEETVEEAKKLYANLVEETRKEEGCIAYNLYQDTKDKCVLVMIEEWENNESLELHMKSPHFTDIVPKIGKLRKSGEITTYDLIY